MYHVNVTCTVLPWNVIVSIYRQCYFTSDSMHKKVDFMRAVNRSSGEGGLTCSFVDKEITQFIQFKKRQGNFPKKMAVPYIGRQNMPESTCPIWVLGPKLFLDNKGKEIDEATSNLVWIGHLVSAPKVAPDDSQLPISLPLGTQSLHELLATLKVIMHHNFYPAILALGATAMALHYSTIIQRNHHCHIPFLTGPSGTGKTTALRSGLSLLGAHEQRFFSRGTTEKYSIHCCESSFPIGCDDPLSEVQTGQLVVDLYNGAKVTTVKRGDMKPLSTAVVSANFTMTAKAR